MKKDWKIVDRLLAILKGIKNTENLHVYITVHRLSDGQIDAVVRKVPTGFEVEELATDNKETGWVKIKSKHNQFGFKMLELTLFFSAYNEEKQKARLKKKGGDKN